MSARQGGCSDRDGLDLESNVTEAPFVPWTAPLSGGPDLDRRVVEAGTLGEVGALIG